MFKDVLQHSNLTLWAEAGLLIFFVTFLGVTIWAFTRSRREVRRWATLPLENGVSPGTEEQRS